MIMVISFLSRGSWALPKAGGTGACKEPCVQIHVRKILHVFSIANKGYDDDLKMPDLPALPVQQLPKWLKWLK